MSKVQLGNKTFICEVADTPERQAKGLMFTMPPVPVMAFPFSDRNTHKFWMKNTPAPLDIVFCDQGTIIDIALGKPHSTQLVGPDAPCDFVVELDAGTCQQHGIQVGQPVKFAR